jgi:hypothetical protein
LVFAGWEKFMNTLPTRRVFGAVAAGSILAPWPRMLSASQADQSPADERQPTEAPFERDYEPPEFQPSWKRPQLNRQLVQDFVIFAHSDLPMVETLLAKEPALLNATMDWGAGDWESGLGGASHMGRRDIAEFLLSKGSRIDIFCAAMLGQLEAVKSFLTLQPALIDARGPHGFSLHFHAQVGGEPAAAVLDYLQTIKHVELKPIPFLNNSENKK